MEITLYENGRVVDFPFDDDFAAVIDEIEDLWAPTYNSKAFFRVDEDRLSLVYIENGSYAKIPEEWITREVRFGVSKPLKLVGDRIPLRTRNLYVQFHPE